MSDLFDNVLVIYKKSLYQIYFMEKRQLLDSANHCFEEEDMARLKASHEAHQQALRDVCEALDAQGITYRLVYRARQMNYEPYSLIISVGGDGTFIEAQRRITSQPILGVNSDPKRSIGIFCATRATQFSGYLEQSIRQAPKIRKFNRMDIWLEDELYEFRAVNEILLAHQSPAAMSRYELQVGDERERQLSSGIWVSTAAGSTGAIRSAGGRAMRLGSRRLQYRPRELYRVPGRPDHYALTGDIVRLDTPIRLKSLMREGMIYIDGPHLRLTLPFGNRLTLQRSAHSLPVLTADD